VSDRVLASRPVGPVDVPRLVRAFAPGAELDAVWRNELGGLTFRLGDGDDAHYVKWIATGTPEIDFPAEANA